MKISPIIHQVYDNPNDPPEILSKISSSWKEFHPKWEYRFWNKQEIENFMDLYYADFIPVYKSFSFDVQRWDAIRYLILYHFGGLYVDMDYECLESLDTLLGDSECCLGLEPYEHALRYNMPLIVGNALMATVPKHIFFKMIIDDIWFKPNDQENDEDAFHEVMNSTGPFMMTRIYNSYPSQDNITLLSPRLIAPLTSEEVRMFINEETNKQFEEKIENAYAIHYFFGSWLLQSK